MHLHLEGARPVRLSGGSGHVCWEGAGACLSDGSWQGLMDIAVPHLVSGGRLDVKADAERGRCGEAEHCQAGEHEEAPVRQGGVVQTD